MDSPDTYVSLFYGYSAIWAIVIVFLIGLAREQHRVHQMLSAALKERLLKGRSTLESLELGDVERKIGNV